MLRNSVLLTMKVTAYVQETQSLEFKTKVAFEALRGVKPFHSIASEAGIHSVQIAQSKKRAQELVDEGFRERRKKENTDDEKLKEELYKQIVQMYSFGNGHLLFHNFLI